ncbi:hypothetical protein [Microbispora bryophytorum]|uniref:Uncharacterized protein n=1 Tax=Microbispora bryophytorum subsp. camponoti TaxID=1677852 RepID=A0ABR8LIR2_9ACTN|nr:hypothetical protein [Microbispora camponoti]MBD3148478.1 hypothetical protein [Microbispora camponoti]
MDSSPGRRHPNDDPSLSADELVRRRVAWFDAVLVLDDLADAEPRDQLIISRADEQVAARD